MGKLKVGDKAPNIESNSVNLGRIDLSSLKGKERVLLVFSRYFGCRLCQLDFHELLQKATEIQNHAKIIYINQSTDNTAKDYIKEKAVPFPVIVDAKEPFPLYQAYNVGDWEPEEREKINAKRPRIIAAGFQHGAYEGNEQQMPASFIISKNGTIEYAKYGDLNLDEIIDFLRKK
jgi:peroxiredoxin